MRQLCPAMSIAEIYQWLGGAAYVDVFRIRDTKTLQDYLTCNGHEWWWQRMEVNVPRRVSAYALDNRMLRVVLECSSQNYTLLSSSDELVFFRTCSFKNIESKLKEMYAGDH